MNSFFAHIFYVLVSMNKVIEDKSTADLSLSAFIEQSQYKVFRNNNLSTFGVPQNSNEIISSENLLYRYNFTDIVLRSVNIHTSMNTDLCHSRDGTTCIQSWLTVQYSSTDLIGLLFRAFIFIPFVNFFVPQFSPP